MIVAEIYRQEDGKINGFKIEGHANTAPRGQDIYCAGVSTVTQSAYICIVKHLQRDICGDSSSGKLYLKLEDSADDLTEAVFQTMLIGLLEIEKLAPQALKVIEQFPHNDISEMEVPF